MSRLPNTASIVLIVANHVLTGRIMVKLVLRLAIDPSVTAGREDWMAVFRQSEAACAEHRTW